MKQQSHLLIRDAFFNAATTYRNDLNESGEAIKLYEELIQRYPNSDYTASSYYQIYSASTNIGNSSKAQQYKQLILSRFPESIYAQVLSNPDFAKAASEEDNKLNKLYEETYQLYQEGNYIQVIQRANDAINENKGGSLLQKFAFIRALSLGKTSDIPTFRRELENIVNSYPNSEVGLASKEIINKIDNFNPEVKKTEEAKRAESTYNTEDKGPLLLAWIVSSNEDLNQLVFDIINFNLDNFNKVKFEVQNADFGKDYKIITIHQFTDRKNALTYYSTFFQSPVLTKNLKDKRTFCFVISEENFKTLTIDKNAEAYLTFFEKYLFKSIVIRLIRFILLFITSYLYFDKIIYNLCQNRNIL
ncbi:MAG: tetratricopeptide repeat protein [Bacteroidales bacterium]|nr:tetratricopeptide repeat protein [Bacteroidales bacterium]